MSDLGEQIMKSIESGEVSVEREEGVVQRFNIGEVSESAKKRAEKIVKSCMELYFEEGLIEKTEYLKMKRDIARANIVTLWEQLKIAEHMMLRLVQQIDSGIVNPRVIEVATGVQQTILDLLKSQQLHIISMQEDMKRVKLELPVSELKKSEEVQSEVDGRKFTNAKQMLQALEEEGEEEGED